MSTRVELLEWAREQVGTVGGSKYWYILQGWSGGGYDWCAVFDSCALKVTGTKCVYFPNTFAFDKIHDGEAIGNRWVDPYELKPGDMVAFHWPVKNDQRVGFGDHVGIVEKVLGGGYYRTVEGNVGNSCGYRYRSVATDGILGGIRPEYDDVPFMDVDSGTSHWDDIRALKRVGVAKGYADETFRPYAKALRGDVATFLYRIAGSPSFTPTKADRARFSDVKTYTPHANEIWWLASRGITTGFADGTFRPDAGVARCDMAAFMHRFRGAPPCPEGPAFKDVDASTPHSDDIAWAASAGLAKGYADGTFRPYEPLLRCDAAAFINRLREMRS